MKKLRTLLVEDMHKQQLRMESLIAGHPSLEHIASCTNGTEALTQLTENRVDVIFMDIRLHGENDTSGLEFIRSLKKIKAVLGYPFPYIVFVSAYPEYAINGFDLDAVDFLKKPVEEARFNETIQKILNRSGQPVLKPKEIPPLFVPAGNGRKLRIDFERITFVCSANAIIQHEDNLSKKNSIPTNKSDARQRRNESFIRLANRYVWEANYTINAMKVRLPATDFRQVHKSYIVNTSEIHAVFRDGRNYYLELRNVKQPIPVGKEYETQIRDFLN